MARRTAHRPRSTQVGAPAPETWLGGASDGAAAAGAAEDGVRPAAGAAGAAAGAAAVAEGQAQESNSVDLPSDSSSLEALAFSWHFRGEEASTLKPQHHARVKKLCRAGSVRRETGLGSVATP